MWEGVKYESPFTQAHPGCRRATFNDRIDRPRHALNVQPAVLLLLLLCGRCARRLAAYCRWRLRQLRPSQLQDRRCIEHPVRGLRPIAGHGVGRVGRWCGACSCAVTVCWCAVTVAALVTWKDGAVPVRVL